MKCPKCGKEGLKYTDKRNKYYTNKKPKKKKRSELHKNIPKSQKADKIAERNNFDVKCKYCNYIGELK